MRNVNLLFARVVHLVVTVPLVLVVVAACPGSAIDAAEKPNIIVVLVDDMGFSDIGCYGSEIETPHLDQLASDGLRFTQFYNSGRCCPTRASLMTGLQPHQVGIGHMTEPPEQPLGFEGAYQGYLNDRCTTLAEVLRSGGYHTLMTGKWHLGLQRRESWPLQRGFDRFYGGLSGAFNYFKPGGGRGMSLGNNPVGTDDDFYATDKFTEVACDFISDACDADDRPFFLYLAYNAPHWPLNAKVKDFEKYKGKYTDGWDALMRNRLAKQVEIGLFPADTVAAPHEGPVWNGLKEKKREELDAIMAAYAGCIDSIDQNIGKLCEHLKSINQFDNTLILFLSDNGACQEGGILGQGSEQMVKQPPLETVAGVRLGQAWANACNTPFRLYKHFVHEGGACTPMIASWPNGMKQIKRGGFVRKPAYLPDVMATCVELSGAKYPTELPPCVGESLVGALTGSRDAIHAEPMYWEHEGNAAMRWQNWKLVREYKQPWELYDIGTDRTELRDLSMLNLAKRNEMVEMWEAWANENQVAFPERFNMYEFLRKKRNAEQQNKKQSKKKQQP